jgi:hypothetical protein
VTVPSTTGVIVPASVLPSSVPSSTVVPVPQHITTVVISSLPLPPPTDLPNSPVIIAGTYLPSTVVVVTIPENTLVIVAST